MKRQDTDEEELERQLCQGKGAGEWFRLETGKDKCRDVIQCTASVRKRSDSKEGRKEWREAQIGIILSHWKKSHIKFVDFLIVVHLISVVICLRFSCTTTKISTSLRLMVY